MKIALGSAASFSVGGHTATNDETSDSCERFADTVSPPWAAARERIRTTICTTNRRTSPLSYHFCLADRLHQRARLVIISIVVMGIETRGHQDADPECALTRLSVVDWFWRVGPGGAYVDAVSARRRGVLGNVDDSDSPRLLEPFTERSSMNPRRHYRGSTSSPSEQATGRRYHATADIRGEFRLVNVAAGNYQIEASLQGFASVTVHVD